MPEITEGKYKFKVSGVYYNGQLQASPYADTPMDITFNGTDEIATWRLVAGSFKNVADGTMWSGYWIFRTDTDCEWRPGGPFNSKTCQCWTANDAGMLTFWNSDHAAAPPPQDYELFSFLRLDDTHFTVTNQRASQGRIMDMIYNGNRFSFVPNANNVAMITVSAERISD